MADVYTCNHVLEEEHLKGFFMHYMNLSVNNELLQQPSIMTKISDNIYILQLVFHIML